MQFLPNPILSGGIMVAILRLRNQKILTGHLMVTSLRTQPGNHFISNFFLMEEKKILHNIRHNVINRSLRPIPTDKIRLRFRHLVLLH